MYMTEAETNILSHIFTMVSTEALIRFNIIYPIELIALHRKFFK